MIIIQPVDQLNVLPGSTVNFSVAVINAVSPQYVWRKDGTPIRNNPRYLGLGTPLLTIVDVNKDDEGIYTVQNVRILSDGAQLTVCK